MPVNPEPQTPIDPTTRVAELRADLHDVAGWLREAHALEPQAQRALAGLVEELMKLLEKENLPEAELDHLAEMTGHLRAALHHQHELGVVGRVQEGFQRALSNAEANAPVAMGLARQLLDTLANIGI
jgi:hypothetical protein